MTVRRIILSCMLVALVGGSAAVGAVAGGAAVFAAARSQQPAPVTAQGTSAPVVEPVSQAPVTSDMNTAVEAAVAKVGPAVVTVVNDLGGGQQASGSGVFI